MINPAAFQRLSIIGTPQQKAVVANYFTEQQDEENQRLQKQLDVRDQTAMLQARQFAPLPVIGGSGADGAPNYFKGPGQAPPRGGGQPSFASYAPRPQSGISAPTTPHAPSPQDNFEAAKAKGGITSGQVDAASKFADAHGQNFDPEAGYTKKTGFADGVTDLPVRAIENHFFDVGERGPEKMKISSDGKLTVIPNENLPAPTGFATQTVPDANTAPMLWKPTAAPVGQYGQPGMSPSQSLQFAGQRENVGSSRPADPPSDFAAAAAAHAANSASETSAAPVNHFAPHNPMTPPAGVRRTDFRRFMASPQGTAFALNRDEEAKREALRTGKEKMATRDEHDFMTAGFDDLARQHPDIVTPDMVDKFHGGSLGSKRALFNQATIRASEKGKTDYWKMAHPDPQEAVKPSEVPEGYEVKPGKFDPRTGKPTNYTLERKLVDPEPRVLEVPGAPNTQLVTYGRALAKTIDTTPKPTGETVDEILAKYPNAKITHRADGGVSYELPAKNPVDDSDPVQSTTHVKDDNLKTWLVNTHKSGKRTRIAWDQVPEGSANDASPRGYYNSNKPQ